VLCPEEIIAFDENAFLYCKGFSRCVAQLGRSHTDLGAAVDYSRASAARAAIINALDATGLMLAKEAETLTQAQLIQRADDYFRANLTGNDAQNAHVEPPELPSPQPGTFLLKLKASGNANLAVTRLLSKSPLPLSAAAEVTWGIKKLELALVLDNTGSMAQKRQAHGA
jgi:Flp pilus assembly protein TadG